MVYFYLPPYQLSVVLPATLGGMGKCLTIDGIEWNENNSAEY